jgi:hypothetical protein
LVFWLTNQSVFIYIVVQLESYIADLNLRLSKYEAAGPSLLTDSDVANLATSSSSKPYSFEKRDEGYEPIKDNNNEDDDAAIEHDKSITSATSSNLPPRKLQTTTNKKDGGLLPAGATPTPNVTETATTISIATLSNLPSYMASSEKSTLSSSSLSAAAILEIASEDAKQPATSVSVSVSSRSGASPVTSTISPAERYSHVVSLVPNTEKTQQAQAEKVIENKDRKEVSFC